MSSSTSNTEKYVYFYKLNTYGLYDHDKVLLSFLQKNNILLCPGGDSKEGIEKYGSIGVNPHNISQYINDNSVDHTKNFINLFLC